MTPAIFDVFKDVSGGFRFNLRSRGNREIILRSESYTTKASCLASIASVKVHSPDDANYQRNGEGYNNLWFNLRAKNYEIIGTSEMYSTKAARETGIAAVKRDGPVAEVRDLTVATV